MNPLRLALPVLRTMALRMISFQLGLWTWFSMAGCGQGSGEEGSPAIRVFLALGICLAAVFLVCYIVIKGREKD